MANTSGIEVSSGINDKRQKLIVSRTRLIGAGVTTDGKNRFKTAKITAKKLHNDRQDSYSYGISANLKNFVPDSSDTQRPGIPTATINIAKIKYRATQKAYLTGNDGSKPDIDKMKGHVDKKRKDGYHITEDKHVRFELDMPVHKRRRGGGNNDFAERLSQFRNF